MEAPLSGAPQSDHATTEYRSSLGEKERGTRRGPYAGTPT